MKTGVGKHLVVELSNCNPHILSNPKLLETILTDAATESKAKVLKSVFHQFPTTGGVTAVVIISESHIALHTWPEYQYAALDIFTCGQSANPWDALKLIVNKLEAKTTFVTNLLRGEKVDKKFRSRLVSIFT